MCADDSDERKIRVLVVDDHAMVRIGLRAFLETQLDFEVVAEAANVEEAVREFARTRPDVTLMDLRLSGRPLIAWLSTRGRLGLKAALIWNVFGIVVLANVVVLAILTTPALHAAHTEVPHNLASACDRRVHREHNEADAGATEVRSPAAARNAFGITPAAL